MNFDFKRALNRGRDTLGEFTAGQKAMTVIAIAALLIGGYLFSSWAAKPSYSPLFTSLAATDASSITDKLTAQKEPFKLADGGTTILVPQKDVYQLRLDMAKDNLPASGSTGFDLLDKGGITTSQFQQNVEYQQAIEDELEKTIESIDGISAAVVNVVIPTEDVFSDDSTKPTASVLITDDPSNPLTGEQVQAIVHLVSSSVEGLDPTDVTVADSQGNVLNAPGADGEATSASSLQDQQTAAYEARVQNAVQTMLEPLVGAGHVVVKVAANLNFNTQTTESESYPQPVSSGSASPLPLSQTKSSETYTGSGGSAATGILGPDNIAIPTSSASPVGSSGAGTYLSENSTTDNAIGRVVQQVQTAPGSVTGMQVAVLLDSTAAKGISTAQIQKLVANAAGVQTSRGDSVEVSTMPFDQTQAKANAKALAAAASAKSMKSLMSYAKDAVLAIILLAVVFLFSRKAKKARSQAPYMTTSEKLELEEARRMLALVSAPEESGGRPALSPSGQGQLEQRPTLDAQIGDLVERQPEEVAQLLRGWLADRRT
jgi:flagellar M-ring protein FliF